MNLAIQDALELAAGRERDDGDPRGRRLALLGDAPAGELAHARVPNWLLTLYGAAAGEPSEFA
jgi:hypothetical protein